jgi:RNA polymerase sigma factor (sigma-70 family)
VPNGPDPSGVHEAVIAQRASTSAGADAEVEVGFEDFFRSTYPRLAQAGLLLTGDRAEAEDLAQEAMARAFERWDRVRKMESPEGYVYRTTLNLHRKRVRRAAVLDRLRLWEQPRGMDPADEVEPRDQVLRILGSLSREQREALVLTGWLGLSAEEAGRVLGIDAASVRGRVHRARAAVREQQHGDGHE